MEVLENANPLLFAEQWSQFYRHYLHITSTESSTCCNNINFQPGLTLFLHCDLEF